MLLVSRLTDGSFHMTTISLLSNKILYLALFGWLFASVSVGIKNRAGKHLTFDQTNNTGYSQKDDRILAMTYRLDSKKHRQAR